jgi:iron(III) transport system substrate-binding protein
MAPKNNNLIHKVVIYSIIALMAFVVLDAYTKKVKNVRSSLGSYTDRSTTDNTVVLYSSLDDALIEPILAQFTQQTGIVVNYAMGEAENLTKKYQAELGYNAIDVFLVGDVAGFSQALSSQLFQSCVLGIAEQKILPPFYDNACRWYGIYYDYRAIFYDKNRVNSKQLDSYWALSSEKLKGSIAVSGEAEADALLALMVDTHQSESASKWAYHIAHNAVSFKKINDIQMFKMISLGEVSAGVGSLSAYLRMLHSENAEDRKLAKSISVKIPNQETTGAFVSAAGVAVFKKAPHKKNAVRLVEFLLESQIQQSLVDNYHVFPVVENVKTSMHQEPYRDVTIYQKSLSALSALYEQAQAIGHQQGW